MAVLGIVIGLVVLYLSVRGPSSFPDRQALTQAVGVVAWTSPDRYGIDFGLEGDSRTFSYARKSGDLAAVSATLDNIAEQPFTVLLLPQPQQGLDRKPFFQVYELRSAKGYLRTHRQIQYAWRADYRYGYLAALLAFIAAGVLENIVRKSQPNNWLA